MIFGSGELQEWGKVEDEMGMKELEVLEKKKEPEEEDAKNEASARLVREDSMCL